MINSVDNYITMILTTTDNIEIDKIKNSSIYPEIIKYVLTSNNELLIIHFILYFEYDMLYDIYGSEMALARTISDGEYSTEIKISYLTRLMGHNDDIFLDRYIMNSLSRILDPEYEKYVYYNEIKNYTYKIQ